MAVVATAAEQSQVQQQAVPCKPITLATERGNSQLHACICVCVYVCVNSTHDQTQEPDEEALATHESSSQATQEEGACASEACTRAPRVQDGTHAI